MEPDLYSSDKEKYISLNISIDGIGVLVTCTNQNQCTKKLSKKHVKQISHQCIENVKEYITPINIWFGKWELVTKSLVPIPVTTPSVIPKIAIPNVNIIMAKKNMEKKRHLWVINILKKFIGAITITKCILNFRVNFIIDKLLASVLAVKKKFIKVISKNKAI